ILSVGITRLPAGLEPNLIQRVVQRTVAGIHLSLTAAIGVPSPVAALGALEIGQHITVGPAARAFRLPALEIERIATDIDHPVDGGGSSQHLAAWRVETAAAEMRLGLRV